MRTVYLPGFMRYKCCGDLVRLGGEYDGGYLVSQKDIEETDILLSFGVNADWRFEKDFLKRNKDLKIQAYDATTSMGMFFSHAYKYMCRLDPVGMGKWLYKALDYKVFFRGRVKHFPSFVGVQDEGFVKLDEILNNIRDEVVFIKMDIEGWEYRCLDDLLRYRNMFSGVVIEFHDVDLHLDKIKKFIYEIGIPIAHIHPTNCAPVSDDGIPMVIEVTFSRHGRVEDKPPMIPHTHDSPACPRKEDYVLEILG